VNQRLVNQLAVLCIPILLLFFAAEGPSIQVVSSQGTATVSASEHFKQGERLLKQGKTYEAFDEFELAAKSEPSKKKYESKLIEVGKVASSNALSTGMSKMSVAPHEALAWLQKAVRYDGSNLTAVQMLAVVNKNILSAAETCKRAQALLDGGNLTAARETAKPLQTYADALPAIANLENELKAADSALAAQQLWEKGDPDAALGELRNAESSFPSSLFVQRIAEKLRGDIAEALVLKASQLPAETPQQLIDKILIVRIALQVHPLHSSARVLENRLSAALENAVLEQIKSLLVNDNADSERLSLETSRVAQSWVGSESRLTEQMTKAQRMAYPRLRVRLLIGNLETCKDGPSHEAITTMLAEALSPVVAVDNQQWDFTLNIKNPSCSATDIPKQSVESVNSTYVAGQNQVANPRYVQLQQDLQTAQADLNRATYNQSINPNFGTGLATGMAQGQVNNIQKAIRQTPPFINRPVIQQYQYEKFESYRGYKIEAKLQLYGKPADQQYFTESRLLALAEGRGAGISGVLPSDNTGSSNTQAGTLPLEAYQKKGLDDFASKLKNKARELVSGYFATKAMDRKLTAIERISANLYLLDLADNTPYEQEKQKLTSIRGALLSREADMQTLLTSLALQVPEQIPSTEARNNDSESPQVMLAKTLEGVLAIETDTGAEGSGFFVTDGCLVVTNAHVVEGAETIVLKTSSKKIFTAQVLAKDGGRDLALLRSNARICTALQLDDSGKALVGEEIYAIGNPLGFSGTVTRGIISARRTDNNGIQYIQLDATINPGNSGGPLLSRNGRVIGVNTFKVRGFEGLNFAIASDEIKTAFGQLLH